MANGWKVIAQSHTKAVDPITKGLVDAIDLSVELPDGTIFPVRLTGAREQEPATAAAIIDAKADNVTQLSRLRG